MTTLQVPGAELHFEVRGTGPLIALVGTPMDAGAFQPVAELLAVDHTVITTDPRGINRSTVADPDADATVELRADDLSRILAHVDAGPAVVFGTSGGAVNVLQLLQDHPEQIHKVIAHEPPFYQLLPDRQERRTSFDRMIELYESGDRVGAWRLFMENANIFLPDEVFDMYFGQTPTGQAAADERYGFLRTMRATIDWQPDLAALRANSAKLLIGIGEESTGELCDRVSRGLAAALDLEPTMFPGGHTGFAEQPEPFAKRFREALES